MAGLSWLLPIRLFYSIWWFEQCKTKLLTHQVFRTRISLIHKVLTDFVLRKIYVRRQKIEILGPDGKLNNFIYVIAQLKTTRVKVFLSVAWMLIKWWELAALSRQIIQKFPEHPLLQIIIPTSCAFIFCMSDVCWWESYRLIFILQIIRYCLFKSPSFISYVNRLSIFFIFRIWADEYIHIFKQNGSDYVYKSTPLSGENKSLLIWSCYDMLILLDILTQFIFFAWVCIII